MNDWVGGFDPYAKGIEIIAESLNSVIEQLDALTARVDKLYEVSSITNNTSNLPDRFKDIANGE